MDVARERMLEKKEREDQMQQAIKMVERKLFKFKYGYEDTDDGLSIAIPEVNQQQTTPF